MTRAAKPQRVEPKYLQLAQRLRDDIASGRLPQGARLESLSEMHLRHGVTRPTVEKARDILEREGLIERVQGRGTFVMSSGGAKSAHASASPGDLMQSTVAVLSILGHESHSQGGWAEYIGLGAMKMLRGQGLHALSLSPGGLERLLEQRPRGVVITDLLAGGKRSGEFASALAGSEVPVAVYGGDPSLEGFDRVASDHEAGAYELTRWLIGQGRTRIAHVWPAPAQGHWYAQRLEGTRRALNEAGLEPSAPILVPDLSAHHQESDLFERKTRLAVGYLAEHLTGAQPPDALMVHTDGDCFAVAAACRMCGREPNTDVAIVGYDNYWAEAPGRRWESSAPLATVDKRNGEMGAELVRLLLERIEGHLPQPPQRRVITPQLVVTQSQQ